MHGGFRWRRGIIEKLVYPTVLVDAVLYIFVSDGTQDTKVDICDKLTAVGLILMAQHVAMVLIGQKEREDHRERVRTSTRECLDQGKNVILNGFFCVMP